MFFYRSLGDGPVNATHWTTAPAITKAEKAAKNVHPDSPSDPVTSAAPSRDVQKTSPISNKNHIANAPNKAYVSPAFSSDGRQVAFAALPPDGRGQIDIYTIDIDGDNLRQVTRGPGRKYGPTWSGNTIFFSSDRDGPENIWSINVDESSRTAAGEEAAVDHTPAVSRR